ncbi:MAG: hypothetical protein GC159_17520 [Phycisphaera sp.]|nr:hypothetical protein [Phycisphaera sp.]
MSTFHLRRFGRVETLASMNPRRLAELLAPHAEYFAGHGVDVSESNIDYEGVTGVLRALNTDAPPGLCEALYFIHEMATPGGMDALVESARSADIHVDPSGTPADVAVSAWLASPPLVQRAHAQQRMRRPRSFETFRSCGSNYDFPVPTSDELAALESRLDDWFDGRSRGRGVRVFVFSRGGWVWFMVRHGEPMKREATMDGHRPWIMYRPQRYDVLIYNPATGDLRVNARSDADKEEYRRAIGRCVFGSDAFFERKPKYSLEPIREAGRQSMVCSDIPGVARVTLTRLKVKVGGPFVRVDTIEASDVFAEYARAPWGYPDDAVLVSATFEVRFTGSSKPRMVTILSSSKAQFVRDEDGLLIEEWMNRRGFCTTGGQYDIDDANDSGSDESIAGRIAIDASTGEARPVLAHA